MNRKSFNVSLWLLILTIGLFSCMKKETNYNDAIVDVYVKSILINGNTALGVEHIVKSNSPMTSVTVTLPDGSKASLYPTDGTGLLYKLQPSINEGTYSATPPAGGTYIYKAVFNNGEEKVFTDVLNNGYILPTDITSITKTNDNQKVQLSFNPVTGADNFLIFIYFQGDLIYVSPTEPVPMGNNFQIPLSVISPFYQGTYTFELDAIKFQSLSTGQYQALSIADIDIDL